MKVEGTLESSDESDQENPVKKIQTKDGILNDKLTVNRNPN